MPVRVTTRPTISSHLTTLRTRRLVDPGFLAWTGFRLTAGPSARRLLNFSTPVTVPVPVLTGARRGKDDPDEGTGGHPPAPNRRARERTGLEPRGAADRTGPRRGRVV